jgi:hypothetical protein
MWVLLACYCVFYVLTLIHIRQINTRAVRSLRLEIHTLYAELLRGMPYAEALEHTKFPTAKFLDDVLTRVEKSPPPTVYIQSLWLTPIIVVSEILGSDEFERSYATMMRTSLLQVLRTTLGALCVHAHRRALEDKKLR